jgi:membrane-associated phospholipid phosphatase
MVLFTRVFLGLHYPSDVLVGAMIGMLIGLLVGGLDLEVQDTAPIWRRSDPSIK